MDGSVPLLSDEDIAARVASLSNEQHSDNGFLTLSSPLSEANSPATAPPLKAADPESIVSPTADAIRRWVDYASNPESRWQTGYRRIDVLTRGLGRGELAQIVGRSHSGKSQFLYNCIVKSLLNNDDFRCVIFSPDEPSELVIAKLYSIMFNVDGSKVEEQLRAADASLVDHMTQLGESGGLFDKLRIYDGSPTWNLMQDVVEEAEEYWGQPATLCMVDYLELLRGDGRSRSSENANVSSLAQGLKRWSKDVDLPVVFVHQSGRGSGDRGKPAGISAGRYGGEAESMFIYEVWRERENTSHTGEMARYHEESLSVALWKNKRPPGRLEQFEFHIDPNSGLISEYAQHLVP